MGIGRDRRQPGPAWRRYGRYSASDRRPGCNGDGYVAVADDHSHPATLSLIEPHNASSNGICGPV
jgi:hypothetical protein